MGSVLVNGSPLEEFRNTRFLGLVLRGYGKEILSRRFLFIQVVLHISFMRVVSYGVFTELNIRSFDPIFIPHLFYVKVAVFIG